MRSNTKRTDKHVIGWYQAITSGMCHINVQSVRENEGLEYRGIADDISRRVSYEIIDF